MTGSDTRYGFEDWEGLGDDELDEEGFEPLEPPAWRRPVLVAVAVVTVLALAIVPLYNVLQGRTLAENGLEVCGFDYCVVQDAVREAGLDATMSRLSNMFIADDEARRFAAELTDHLRVAAVTLDVVDGLEGRVGGLYDPSNRLIRVERPVRAWTVLHEVAHVIEGGHGEGFRDVVIELTRWVEDDTG